VSTAVWPGDRPFEIDWTLQHESGHSVNVAVLTMSPHTGTHVDGGYHVLADGARAADLALDPFVGSAVVVDVTDAKQLDERVLQRFDASRTRRVLFRTRGAIDETEFPSDFMTPTPALARQLMDAGVMLVGTDAPSMDPFDSKTLETHRILLEGGAAILENLVLTDVKPGRYTLIALPLKLVEADASPVRAILIEGDLRDG
jgi:arylformamidase